jgi:hypothetical protein
MLTTNGVWRLLFSSDRIIIHAAFGARRQNEGGIMNCRAMALALGLAIALVAQSGSHSAAIGTWKQDLAKSKYNPGPARTTPATLKIEAVQGGERVSVESSDDEGKPTSYSYTATHDGKPTPVTGSPYGDSVSLKRSNSK